MLLLLLTFSKVHIYAQDSWTLTHNGILRLQTGTEDIAKNTIGITRSGLKKTGHLCVEYTETENKNNRGRFVVVRNKSGAVLLQQKSSRLKVDNVTLNSWAKRYKKIMLYTYASPTDPNIKARVWVRCVHLCTITLR